MNVAGSQRITLSERLVLLVGTWAERYDCAAPLVYLARALQMPLDPTAALVDELALRGVQARTPRCTPWGDRDVRLVVQA